MDGIRMEDEEWRNGDKAAERHEQQISCGVVLERGGVVPENCPGCRDALVKQGRGLGHVRAPIARNGRALATAYGACGARSSSP